MKMSTFTISGSDGDFFFVSTGRAPHQHTFKIKVLRNNPANDQMSNVLYYFIPLKNSARARL